MMKKKRILNVVSRFGGNNKAMEVIEKTDEHVVERIFHEVYELLRSQKANINTLTCLSVLPMNPDSIGVVAFHQALITDDGDYFDTKQAVVPISDADIEWANIYLIAALSIFVNTEEFSTTPSTIVVTVEVDPDLFLMFREKFPDVMCFYIIPEKPGVPVDKDLLVKCGYYYLYPETIRMVSRKEDSDLLNQDPTSKNYVDPDIMEIGLRSLIRPEDDPEDDDECMDEEQWEGWINSPEPGAGYDFKIGAGYALWMLSCKVQLFDHDLSYSTMSGLLKFIRMASNVYQDNLSVYPYTKYLVGGEMDLKEAWDLVKSSPEDAVTLFKEVSRQAEVSVVMTSWAFPAIAESIKDELVHMLMIEDLTM